MGVRSLWRIGRQDVRAILVVCIVVACCICASAAMAGTPPVPIEGTILVSADGDPLGVYFIRGTSDNRIPAPILFARGEISPYADRVAYSFTDAWPETQSDVSTAKIDGSDIVNLTALAGLGGVNCNPAWSPDARQIAFQHAEPTSSLTPCKAGFHVWVINADGTGAHRVTALGASPTKDPSWAPDGHRLTCWSEDGNAIALNADGTDLVVLPNVADYPEWSRDGASIISTTYDEGTDGGQTGMWRRIVLTDRNGGNPRVLFERFISDADVATHVALYGSTFPAGSDPVGIVQEGVGPSNARWSPTGTRILFRAAFPFDPTGLAYSRQVELWLLDVATGDLTRITENDATEYDHSWDGDNTYPDHPSVTVDNTTVTFSQVLAPGLTTIIRQDLGATIRADQVAVPPFFWIYTTAQVSGPISVSMTYDDAAVPAAAEGHLALAHYDPESRMWFTQPPMVDPIHNVVSGQLVSLGGVGLMWPLPASQFSDVASSATDPYWALWEIEAAYAAGIVKGYDDGTYKPADPVTRDQMAVYIARALAGGDSKVPSGPATASFPDAPTAYWAYRYIEYCYGEHIVVGYSDGYRPTEQVTRSQMAVYVARSVVTPAGDAGLVSYTPPGMPSFADVPTNHWAYEYIEYCKAQGIVQGYSDGYHPEDVVTRDQMAVYVARAFKLAM